MCLYKKFCIQFTMKKLQNRVAGWLPMCVWIREFESIPHKYDRQMFLWRSWKPEQQERLIRLLYFIVHINKLHQMFLR